LDVAEGGISAEFSARVDSSQSERQKLRPTDDKSERQPEPPLLSRESASELSDRRPEKSSSSAGLVRNSCDRRSAGLLPSTSSLVDGGDTAARLLAPGVNLANGSVDRPVGGARVLHPRGRRAAVAPSVGVTPGVPKMA
jgi:hypothetical protein